MTDTQKAGNPQSDRVDREVIGPVLIEFRHEAGFTQNQKKRKPKNISLVI
jgi:hypothetical protein